MLEETTSIATSRGQAIAATCQRGGVDADRFEQATGSVIGKRLTYRELIGANGVWRA